MASERKIATNRRNAQKSTGPKTARGKALSRFNAVSSGVYATARVLPGEDRMDYAKLLLSLDDEFDPQGPTEGILVNQILGDMWRLRRVEAAEHIYLIEVQMKVQLSLARALSDEEKEHVRKKYGEDHIALRIGHMDKHTEPELMSTSDRIADIMAGVSRNRSLRELSDEEAQALEGKLEAFHCLEHMLLEGLVPKPDTNPIEEIGRQRRSLMNDLRKNLATLTALQAKRKTISLPIVDEG